MRRATSKPGDAGRTCRAPRRCRVNRFCCRRPQADCQAAGQTGASRHAENCCSVSPPRNVETDSRPEIACVPAVIAAPVDPSEASCVRNVERILQRYRIPPLFRQIARADSHRISRIFIDWPRRLAVSRSHCQPVIIGRKTSQSICFMAAESAAKSVSGCRQPTMAPPEPANLAETPQRRAVSIIWT